MKTYYITFELIAISCYVLAIDNAYAANTIGDTNANNDASMDIISIANPNENQQSFLTNKNYTINTEEKAIPEFGPMSYMILIMSLISIVILSSKSILRSKI